MGLWVSLSFGSYVEVLEPQHIGNIIAERAIKLKFYENVRKARMHYKEAKSILSANNNMNIYRRMHSWCIYCDSRSKCYHMEHDFEDVEVKINAPELRKRSFGKRKNA